jgi:hypothetical protein
MSSAVERSCLGKTTRRDKKGEQTKWNSHSQ